ncbi:GntR family transcriptional regulator [Pseudonocardia sp.]|jgi:GntR family transcriptional regulator|uniref:GntR family transcriptional regulator n=1 Tax=Pseudonocardia sp. TaxID=60912 RepID=UPI0031FC770D
MSQGPVLKRLRMTGGKPLRVAVYGEITQAIRAGRYTTGELLPNESELSLALGVSRTVVREALLLMEEDGLIRTRRGVGRFVADVLPPIGLGQLRPLEEIVDTTGEPVRVRRTLDEVQTVSEFIATGLGLDEDATAWVWKSVIYRGDRPMAFTMECVPAGQYLIGIEPQLTDIITERPDSNRTLLGLIMDSLGPVLGPGTCEIGIGTTGAERADSLGLPADAAVLVLTQTVLYDGRSLYLAKHLISPECGHLAVVQSAQG